MELMGLNFSIIQGKQDEIILGQAFYRPSNIAKARLESGSWYAV